VRESSGERRECSGEGRRGEEIRGEERVESQEERRGEERRGESIEERI
jgi:hypothetical protein